MITGIAGISKIKIALRFGVRFPRIKWIIRPCFYSVSKVLTPTHKALQRNRRLGPRLIFAHDILIKRSPAARSLAVLAPPGCLWFPRRCWPGRNASPKSHSGRSSVELGILVRGLRGGNRCWRWRRTRDCSYSGRKGQHPTHYSNSRRGQTPIPKRGLRGGNRCSGWRWTAFRSSPGRKGQHPTRYSMRRRG